MDWFWSNLLGGIKLCVRESDTDAASDLLDLDIPENFDLWSSAAGIKRETASRLPDVSILNSADRDCA